MKKFEQSASVIIATLGGRATATIAGQQIAEWTAAMVAAGKLPSTA